MATDERRESKDRDEALIEQIAERRNDADFMARLRTRLDEDAAILDRLGQHQCRYPAPNQRGFPVNQCLDCGGWIIAPPDLSGRHSAGGESK